MKGNWGHLGWSGSVEREYRLRPEVPRIPNSDVERHVPSCRKFTVQWHVPWHVPWHAVALFNFFLKKYFSFSVFRAIPVTALDANQCHAPNYPALSMCMPLTIRV